jgi:hypothetical protein
LRPARYRLPSCRRGSLHSCVQNLAANFEDEMHIVIE